jgi:hypothetical protein
MRTRDIDTSGICTHTHQGALRIFLLQQAFSDIILAILLFVFQILWYRSWNDNEKIHMVIKLSLNY